MQETPLITVQEISKAVAAKKLFSSLSLGLFSRDRIGLIGPNGSGKSTLLKILAGAETPDQGTRSIQRNSKVGFVQQESLFPANASVESVFREALSPIFSNLDELEINVAKGINWLGLETQGMNGQSLASELSGGWQKRLAICAELLKSPDVLFLDEPTNHLDFEGIHWLEKKLRAFKGAFMLVSHDRSFLEKACTKVVELNPRYENGLFSCEGTYSFFLQKREEYLTALGQYQASLANKVKREVAWLRQGVKARTTKSKSRIQAAENLQDELADLKSRSRHQKANIDFQDSGRRTKKLVELKNVSQEFSPKLIFKDLNIEIRARQKIGLVGQNGSGKTTFLKLVAKELEATEGEVKFADDLRVVYFDQTRDKLDFEASLQDNLADGGDTVIYQGRSMAVQSYSRQFLFQDSHLRLPVSQLSGGERARLQIARLMLREADLLLLDEPTNDLDIETIELLSENISGFEGSVIIVSHDRYFLDECCDKVLAFELGRAPEEFASLSQWEKERSQRLKPQSSRKGSKGEFPPSSSEQNSLSKNSKSANSKKRLSYNEKREWEQMEEKILVSEEALDKWKARVEDPAVATDPEKIKEAFQKMSEAQKLVDDLYARWAELEEKIPK